MQQLCKIIIPAWLVTCLAHHQGRPSVISTCLHPRSGSLASCKFDKILLLVTLGITKILNFAEYDLVMLKHNTESSALSGVPGMDLAHGHTDLPLLHMFTQVQRITRATEPAHLQRRGAEAGLRALCRKLHLPNLAPECHVGEISYNEPVCTSSASGAACGCCWLALHFLLWFVSALEQQQEESAASMRCGALRHRGSGAGLRALCRTPHLQGRAPARRS